MGRFWCSHHVTSGHTCKPSYDTWSLTMSQQCADEGWPHTALVKWRAAGWGKWPFPAIWYLWDHFWKSMSSLRCCCTRKILTYRGGVCTVVRYAFYQHIWGILPMYTNTWREGGMGTEPGSLQWYPGTGQETMGTSWDTGGSFWT